MSYINFKEEKYKATIQLEKRKRNNKQIYDEILKGKHSLQGYSPNEEYSYKNIKSQIVGKKGIFQENNFSVISNEDIICAKFIECNFQNIKFVGCKFIGCIFERCNFNGGGVIFENCIFIKEESDKSPSLNKKANIGCSFYSCNLYVKYTNCDISFSIFEDCIIRDSKIEITNTQNSIFYKSNVDMLEIVDCDFSGFKTLDCYIEDMYFNDKYKTKFDEKTFFDKLIIKYKTKEEYEGVYMTYEVLADKFKENSLVNNFGEYYYLAKCIERKCIKILPKIWYTTYWLTCGYGERPWFCVISSLVMILLFSIIYLIVGMELNGEIIKYSLNNINTWNSTIILRDINEAIHLSIGMFGGVGCDSATPTPLSYTISNIEMLIGIVMMGLGIGTLTRKVIR